MASTATAQVETASDLAQRAHYIFRGKVEQVGVSNVKLLKPSVSTAIVKLEELLHGPSTLDMPGRSVTVQLRSAHEVKVGDDLVFFTDVMYMGENLALRELGNERAGEPASMRNQVQAGLQAKSDSALRERLAEAEFVVKGQVIKVAPVEGKPHGISEHEPHLYEAMIAVQSAMKGNAGKEVTVFFPLADDPFWNRTPQLKVGESGIFLLRPNPNKRLPTSGLTALDPLDVQPDTATERVTKLMGTIR
jgi:hypothetical protein